AFAVRHLMSVKHLLRTLVLVALALVNPDASAAAVFVPAGGDLQAAINRATPGDQILLPPGATFTGLFTLPRKPDVGGLDVVIRTASDDRDLPPEQRVEPANGRKMARLVANAGAAAVMRTASAAGHYRFVGL